VPDPRALLRSRSYVGLLLVAAVLGVPVSAVAYGFLALVDYLQKEIFTHLPHGLGFQAAPVWWPLPVLAAGGLIVAAAIRYLPGDGGPSPAGGFKLHGAPAPAQLPGIVLAALATLIFGAVLGPEMPLIMLGGGLVLVFLRLARRDVPEQGRRVLASAGSFAAISTLMGSPILGAFLLMEASGLGGPMLGVVLVPGLLAAGVGTLVFVGLDAWTGLGTFSLAIPGLPHFSHPDVAEFGWALVIGAAAPFAGWGIRWLARRLHTYAGRRPLLILPLAGLAVAGLAIGYAEATGKSSDDVLFSGQSALGPLIQHSSTYTVGALLLLVLGKALAYGISLGSFRGGPIFPALFIGAAGGIAMSHLPGLPLVPAVAMGLGAMSAVMLTLPLTSVLLATILLFSDGLAVTPLVIVAVVVAYVVAARIAPADDTDPVASTGGDSVASPAADDAARPDPGRNRSPGAGDDGQGQTRSDRTR
jgi:H+/Cl- antiporter ClcA